MWRTVQKGQRSKPYLASRDTAPTKRHRTATAMRHSREMRKMSHRSRRASPLDTAKRSQTRLPRPYIPLFFSQRIIRHDTVVSFRMQIYIFFAFRLTISGKILHNSQIKTGRHHRPVCMQSWLNATSCDSRI